VLGHSFPWIEKIGQFTPVKFGLKKLYSFISYNRKVIIPNAPNTETKLQCVPSFNIKYRLLYILFASLVTVLILFNFSESINLLPQSSIGRETVLTLGQIVFQSLFLVNYNKKDRLNYIGNLMTVSLMGSLLLIPLLLINSIVNLSEWILLISFGGVVLTMFIEHYRRIKLLQFPYYLSYTWVLYRTLVLIIITF
jgi:hypothetical protein